MASPTLSSYAFVFFIVALTFMVSGAAKGNVTDANIASCRLVIME